MQKTKWKNKCKSDQGPTRQTWFWKKSCKNQENAWKMRKFANCVFAPAFFLHLWYACFFCIVFCTCIFFGIFDSLFFAVHGAFFKFAVF
jgi:hypothetical protein